jgi:hypothetical protein
MAILAYAGIENEFRVFIHREPISGWHEDSLKSAFRRGQIRHYQAGDYYLHTAGGGVIYLDIMEPEVCTAPSRIERGFASEVAHNLYVERHHLLELFKQKQYSLAGYSSHVNISVDTNKDTAILRMIGVPLSMFTTNPLSIGIRVRRNKDYRLELMSEYIENLDQVRAGLLFYAASWFALANEDNFSRFPLKMAPRYKDKPEVIYNVVNQGREAEVSVVFRSESKAITLQDYLESAYRLLKPVIRDLGTAEEINNLEGFISGRKKLEMDRQKFYRSLVPEYEADRLIAQAINPASYRKHELPKGDIAMLRGMIATQGRTTRIEDISALRLSAAQKKSRNQWGHNSIVHKLSAFQYAPAKLDWAWGIVETKTDRYTCAQSIPDFELFARLVKSPRRVSIRRALEFLHVKNSTSKFCSMHWEDIHSGFLEKKEVKGVREIFNHLAWRIGKSAVNQLRPKIKSALRTMKPYVAPVIGFGSRS